MANLMLVALEGQPEESIQDVTQAFTYPMELQGADYEVCRLMSRKLKVFIRRPGQETDCRKISFRPSSLLYCHERSWPT